MTEKEATEYLALTARTLRNYRRSGKIIYREVPGKTRPVIEYDKADLDKLKVELERRRKRSAKAKTAPPALPRITFSLTPEEYQELARDAQKAGLTPSEYARRFARERLESRYLAENKELREELSGVKAENRKIRKEFASGFEVVLEQIGFSAEDAKRWVDKNLR